MIGWPGTVYACTHSCESLTVDCSPRKTLSSVMVHGLSSLTDAITQKYVQAHTSRESSALEFLDYGFKRRTDKINNDINRWVDGCGILGCILSCISCPSACVCVYVCVVL